MIIVDHLIHIESLPDDSKKEYAKNLYKLNKKFAYYCDLCYKSSKESIYENGYAFPLYRVDNVPVGSNWSKLEVIDKTIELLYDDDIDFVINKTILVMESISEIENSFLKMVLLGDIPWFDRDIWKCVKLS